MADKKDDSDSESAKKPVNWGEIFSILMVHAGMTKEEIGNSSIPFIFAIMSTMGKRLCEKLGVPYKTKEEREEEKKQIILFQKLPDVLEKIEILIKHPLIKKHIVLIPSKIFWISLEAWRPLRIADNSYPLFY